MSQTAYTEIACDLCPSSARSIDRPGGWAFIDISGLELAEEHFDLCPHHQNLTVAQLLEQLEKRKSGEVKRWYEPVAEPRKRR